MRKYGIHADHQWGRWLVALSAGAGWISKGTAAEMPRPNILMILTDDESWFERSAYGRSTLPTPNFDRIAKSGVLFTRAYCSAPSCAPARAALLTGRNFWELEQGAFIQAWLPQKFDTYPLILERNGYFTGKTGKAWGPGAYPPGAHTREAGPAFDAVHNPDREARPYLTQYEYAANFKMFLDAKPDNQPFCFWIGINEPHAPWAKNGAELLKTEYGVSLDDVRVPGFFPDTPGVRKEYANMVYELCYADTKVGEILDLLETRGLLENTLIVFAGDNGSSVARAKATIYDAGVHVPMAVMWPKGFAGGRRVDDFVGFADVGPTFLEAAGVKIPEEMSGKSFLDVLRSGKSGQVNASRDFTVNGLEWHGESDEGSTKAGRSIRVGNYTYILHYGQPKSFAVNFAYKKPDSEFQNNYENIGLRLLLSRHGEHPMIQPYADVLTRRVEEEELYDLSADPWEMKNLAADPAYAKIKADLKARLLKYQEMTGDPRVTGNMKVFEETLKYVKERQRNGYRD